MATPQQLPFADSPAAPADLTPDPGADYGEVFTRRWVVELILDLVGYTPDRDLRSHVLVKPSCGTGAFLGPVADRLIESCRRHGHDLRLIASAVRAFDLLDANAERARKDVAARLHEAGLDRRDAEAIAQTWITTGDFLLHGHAGRTADYVVGNPPYVRLESVPRSVMDSYRQLCPTMRGRGTSTSASSSEGCSYSRRVAASGSSAPIGG